MTDDAERVEFDGLEIERRHLDGPGTTLAELLSLLEVDPAAAAREHAMPDDGWRVLHRDASGVAMLGPPDPFDRHEWWSGRVTPSMDPGGMPRWAGSRQLRRPRPLRSERRRGLALRWPRIPSMGLRHLAVDMLNAGESVWLPHDENLHVTAVLRADDQPARGGLFAYIAGGAPAVSLAPGDYVRLPVALQPTEWPEAPGRFQVTAVVPDLELESDPLEIDVTAADVAAAASQRRRRPEPPPPPIS